MIRQHHQLNKHESEQLPGDSEGQGSLVCCNPWDHKELDMTQQLSNKKKILESKEEKPKISKVSMRKMEIGLVDFKTARRKLK